MENLMQPKPPESPATVESPAPEPISEAVPADLFGASRWAKNIEQVTEAVTIMEGFFSAGSTRSSRFQDLFISLADILGIKPASVEQKFYTDKFNAGVTDKGMKDFYNSLRQQQAFLMLSKEDRKQIQEASKKPLKRRVGLEGVSKASSNKPEYKLKEQPIEELPSRVEEAIEVAIKHDIYELHERLGLKNGVEDGEQNTVVFKFRFGMTLDVRSKGVIGQEYNALDLKSLPLIPTIHINVNISKNSAPDRVSGASERVVAVAEVVRELYAQKSEFLADIEQVKISASGFRKPIKNGFNTTSSRPGRPAINSIEIYPAS